MSTERKELGKIDSVKFGLCGYQEAMLGLQLCFSFDGSGVCDDKSYWDKNMIECSDGCGWSEDGRAKEYADIMYFISDTLHDAKVDSVEKLKGIPVEVTFNGNIIKSWRVLKEVL